MTRTKNLSNFVLSLLFLLILVLLGCSQPAEEELSAPAGLTPRPAGGSQPALTVPPLAESPPSGGEEALVTYVFDGDTIEVEMNGRSYRLRYIGVDSPEREEPFYREAFDFNRGLVEDQTVTLVRDVSETDQYGRLLRYVYLTDGTFVNGELMRNGMARLVTFPPDVTQTDYLRDLQEAAREEGVGMWSRPDLIGPCDCDRNLYDCRDFRSQDEAQICFEFCRDTTGQDVHHLDGGGDGFVCESRP